MTLNPKTENSERVIIDAYFIIKRSIRVLLKPVQSLLKKTVTIANQNIDCFERIKNF